MRRPSSSGFAAAALFASALVLSACTEPRAIDYREKYPLPVHAETITLPLHPAQAGALPPDEDAQLASLAAGYLNRGHGPLIVLVPADDKTSGAQIVRSRLMAAGIPGSAIRLEKADTVENVTLSYQRYEVALPQCGDWSSAPSFNPYNDVSSNFGCANQRNLGLMVADPADLVHMRSMDPTDAQNSGRVIQKYRAGQPPAAVQTPLQLRGALGTTSAAQ